MATWIPRRNHNHTFCMHHNDQQTVENLFKINYYPTYHQLYDTVRARAPPPGGRDKDKGHNKYQETNDNRGTKHQSPNILVRLATEKTAFHEA